MTANEDAADLCMRGTKPHPKSAHGSEHPHNPWSWQCVRNAMGEPTCPDARCWTCDA